MDSRPYDMVIYGASGFTGQFVAIEAVRICPDKKIAIAGRTKTKLEKVIERIKTELGEENVRKDIGIVIADNSNDESIREMCRQCKVVLNCVGPYRWYGEQVVRACVEMGTSHVDISGEPEYLQTCQIKYHEEAMAKGIYIVGACGFDSVPADVGLEVLRDKFPGELTAAESYIRLYGSAKGNYGTYLTIIHSVLNRENVKAQQKELFKEKPSYVGPRLQFRGPGFSQSENKWFVPFMGADPSVVKRTQVYESKQFNKIPIQYAAYFCMGSLLYLIGAMIFALNMFIFTRFPFGVKLLENYPKVFSFGVFSKDGVPQADLRRNGFSIVFHGKGYKSAISPSEDPGKPDQSMSVRFSGPEIGYIFTSSCIVAAAATILDDKIRSSGGVLTPGSAFRDTGFMDRLYQRGFKMEVL